MLMLYYTYAELLWLLGKRILSVKSKLLGKEILPNSKKRKSWTKIFKLCYSGGDLFAEVMDKQKCWIRQIKEEQSVNKID